MSEGHCQKCGGFVGEPGKLYGYAGQWCYCKQDSEECVNVNLRHAAELSEGASIIMDQILKINELEDQLTEKDKEITELRYRFNKLSKIIVDHEVEDES